MPFWLVDGISGTKTSLSSCVNCIVSKDKITETDEL
jgi:hypothetical protein